MSISCSNDENVERLALAHPAIIAGRAPSYSYLPVGWYMLVDTLCSRIEQELEPSLIAGIRVVQIKEKFGTLRFYTHLDGAGDVHVDVVGNGKIQKLVFEHEIEREKGEDVTPGQVKLRELVDHACEASSRTWDECGAPGLLRPLSWARTLCDHHFML